MDNDIIKREEYRGYIDSLINAGLRFTEDHWRFIIKEEDKDLSKQVEDYKGIDIDYVIDWLKEEGFILDDGKVSNQYGKEIWYNAAVDSMDDELREELHMELAPCTDQTFFEAYAERHKEKFGEEWFLDGENPVY